MIVLAGQPTRLRYELKKGESIGRWYRSIRGRPTPSSNRFALAHTLGSAGYPTTATGTPHGRRITHEPSRPHHRLRRGRRGRLGGLGSGATRPSRPCRAAL